MLRLAFACLVCAAIGLVGCSAPAAKPDLSSSRASSRVPALVELSVREPGEAPADPGLLVKRLDDPDPAVRLFAIGSLQRLTDRRFGYRWYRDAAGRRASVEAWESWADAR